jgi:hypothetical protein
MDLAWRESLGDTAVEAHTDAIRNGQETEPFDVQALDAITNILHAAKANWDGEGKFDADKMLNTALIHFNTEQEEEEQD